MTLSTKTNSSYYNNFCKSCHKSTAIIMNQSMLGRGNKLGWKNEIVVAEVNFNVA